MRLAVLLAFTFAFASSARAAESRLALEAATDRTFYQHASDNEIYVGARILAPAAPADAPRSTRNIALVLDRSGSMAGEPIVALRHALVAGVAALAPSDYVAVVVFGSEVETLLESQRRDEINGLENLAATIEPAGGAALHDALSQAAAQVRRHAAPDAFNHLVLVTDGPPTKGPRELADFARLAEALAVEGITLSTIGLGAEINEDMLAAMARAGHGHFHFVENARDLPAVLQREIGQAPLVVAHDVELTFEFRSTVDTLKSRSWRAGAITDTTIAFRFPRILAGEEPSTLVSAELDSFYSRFDADFVTVRLAWRAPGALTRHEQSMQLVTRFTNDVRAQRETTNVGVLRQGVDSHIREGLQKVIEQIDRGDTRRAARTLRSTRAEARDLNFDFDDPQIAEKISRLDAYLGELATRGEPGAAERKLLRSGLRGAFDPPAEDTSPRR